MRFFNQFHLQTPESVELEFTLAGIGNRTLALLIDYVVLLLSLFLFWFFYLLLIPQFESILEALIPDNIGMWLLAIASLISFFFYMGYFVIFESLWQGQTPGKRVTKIRVIQDNGRRAGLGQATMRSLLRPVDDLFFLGVFMIVLGKKEKRLGDWVAGTIVIQEDRATAPANFAIDPLSQKLALELNQLTEIDQLLPEEFATIREYLQRRSAMSKKARINLSQQLGDRLQSILHLETQTASPDIFLEAIYLAYQNIHSS
jgi:uncharacterized RDD family membrane protein YckC